MRFTLTLLASSVFFAACGMLQDERTPIVRSTGNKAFFTTLNDTQLKAKGLNVLYRFQSIPNAVLLNERAGNPQILPLAEQSFSLFNEHDAAKKTFDLNRADDVAERTDKPDDPYFDGRFDDAIEHIKQAGVTLAPMHVALIDSGIRAATEPIKQMLASTANLSLDTDESTWQPHATAIASLFSGLTISENRHNADAVTLTSESQTAYHSYAPNTKLHSFKIAFNNVGRIEEVNPLYGNYQLAVAIDSAVQSGARIINMSFTYSSTPASEKEVNATERLLIANAQTKGVIFVSAAGNAALNLDDSRNADVLPARFDLDNVLTVGSHTHDLRRTASSSYGLHVDLTAEGDKVPVNDSAGRQVYYSGTSFASPMVCAALSLYFGVLPDASYSDALADLFATTRPGYVREGGDTKTVSRYGKLDAAALIATALAKHSKQTTQARK